MGGVGKTTLAQWVYNDKKVNEHFELKIWDCVSDPFDVKKLTRTILRSIDPNVSVGEALNNLQEKLVDKLTGKRFLLVLDDVWSKEKKCWDDFWAPFRTGAKGSKILITTRNEDVARIMQTVHTHKLESLLEKDSWELFRQHAFRNLSHVDSRKESIGKEIVKKCKGLPLAISTIGALLCSTPNVDGWEEILKSKRWGQWDDKHDETLSSLLVSYHYLPAPLKRCFAYCSIFPKDYEFDKEKLVLLWAAEGLLPITHGDTVEQIGRKYFDNLLLRSFFQLSRKNTFTMHDLMSDLAQEVSKGVCFKLDDEMEVDGQYEIPTGARHSSYIQKEYDAFSKFEPLSKCKALRTFLPLEGGGVECLLPNKVLFELLPKLRYLRMLSLNSYQISELPESIKNLKHLRYLDLSSTYIERLPESICCIYNLQTLLLHYCRKLHQFPDPIKNLKHLRYLDLSRTKIERLPESICDLHELQTLLLNGCKCLFELPMSIGKLTSLRCLDTFRTKLEKMPTGIGNLRSLHALPEFIVAGVDGQGNGASIEELKELSDLRGSLSIRGLQNVDNAREAMEANFANKQYLDALILQWKGGPDTTGTIHEEERLDQQSKVLEAILNQPVPMDTLKNLVVMGYEGRCIPGLDLDREVFEDGDEGSGKHMNVNFHHLQSLVIGECSRLKRIQQLHFPALEVMIIHGCAELTALFSMEKRKKSQCSDLPLNLTVFPILRELRIWNCPKLNKLPSNLPSSLVKLEITRCLELEALPRFASIRELNLGTCNDVVLETVVGLTTLVSLTIAGLKKLRVLPKQLLDQLTALEDLTICKCNRLESSYYSCPPQGQGWPDCAKLEVVQLSSLIALEKLELERVLVLPITSNQLGTMLPPTLQCLGIEEIKDLECFPDGMISNSHLENLNMQSCSRLKRFTSGGGERLPCESLRSLGLTAFTPADATNLKDLYIADCKNLESIPEGLHNLRSVCVLVIHTCPLIESIIITQDDNNIVGGGGGFGAITTAAAITNLQRIDVCNCESLKSITLQHHNLCLSSLKNLRIRWCPRLQHIPEHGEWLSPSLQSLNIEGCPNPRPLAQWGFHKLSCLTNLCIRGGREDSLLERLLPSTLTSLEIGDFSNLRSLSKGLHHLTSLQKLQIVECPKLSALPEDALPVNLSALYIQDCPRFEKQYLKKKNKKNGIHMYSHICVFI
ncbi:putative disease resistance protein At3g14460 [Malania oleifera]|uniref:putative disease resistance protein At3g14460 n=1 Tax=Malania oleifera TaxID=397392 RepID=UPI0025AE6776|nr:putative disease resistance protein At3g14460 [Malania oleifera]